MSSTAPWWSPGQENPKQRGRGRSRKDHRLLPSHCVPAGGAGHACPVRRPHSASVHPRALSNANAPDRRPFARGKADLLPEAALLQAAPQQLVGSPSTAPARYSNAPFFPAPKCAQI